MFTKCSKRADNAIFLRFGISQRQSSSLLRFFVSPQDPKTGVVHDPDFDHFPLYEDSDRDQSLQRAYKNNVFNKTTM